MRLSQGFFNSGSMLFLMKLKNDVMWAYRVRLVCCFLLSVILFRNVRISFEETSSISLPPNSLQNLESVNS
jgi:hypothetical protein